MLRIHWSKKGWIVKDLDAHPGDSNEGAVYVPQTLHITGPCRLAYYGSSGFVEVDGVLEGNQITPKERYG